MWWPAMARAEMGILASLLWVPLALGVCALPFSPGCSPGESLPRQEELFLTLVLDGRNAESSVSLDRSGRSLFNPDYTEWMLSAPSVCRTIPVDDLRQIENALTSLADDPGDGWAMRPEPPVLLFGFSPDGERRVFFVRPHALLPPEREHALRIVLTVMEQTYGDRFVRELHGAGLLPLLREPPRGR